MHQRRHPNCLNCGAPTPGEFCGTCGQRNTDLHVSVRELVADVLSEAFEADARIARTVKPFLLRPGFLTNEHNAGRRARYSSPLRVYLFCSVLYFLSLSLTDVPQVETAANRGRGVYFSDRGKQPGGDVHIARLGAFGRRLETRINQVKHLPAQEKQDFTRRMQASVVENLPKAMFVLVPLAALLLKLLFWRSRKYYVEHLTFALHAHALAFLVLLGVDLLLFATHDAVWPALFTLAIPAYVLIALRNVYGQAWGWTVVKGAALGAAYGVLIAFASAAVTLIGFLTA